MRWNDGITRPVLLDGLGQQYRRYRLADPEAEEAMAGSLRRWGQLSPVVACLREQKLELLDGFKRYAAARQVCALTSLSVRVLEVDEPTAKAATLGLNRDQRPVRELEEAWVVQGLVRDDGLTQVEAAHLLGRHKSWVCRRLALLEKLSVAVKEDLRLGLVGPSLARQLTRLPTGNQDALLALTRRGTLTTQEVSGVIDPLQGASAEQAAFVLASLWYKIIDARSQRASTALVTNIDFEAWADYLGDAPLAMARLDRGVDGATIVRMKGKSYRVHRSTNKLEAR